MKIKKINKKTKLKIL